MKNKERNDINLISYSNSKEILVDSIDQCNVSICSIDLHFTINYCNQHFISELETTINVKLDINSNLLNALPKENRQIWEEQFSHILNRKNMIFENVFLINDNPIYLLISGSPIIKNDTVIGATIWLRNITERKLWSISIKNHSESINKLINFNNDLIFDTDLDINYKKISDMMLSLSNAKFVVLNILNPNTSDIETKSISGLSENEIEFVDSLRIKFNEEKWESNFNKNSIDNIIQEFDSLNYILKNEIDKDKLALIQNNIRIEKTAKIKINCNFEVFGNFILVYPTGKPIENRSIIELFSFQIGNYLARKKADNEKQANEERYRYLFEENPEPMLIFEMETLKILEVNPSAIREYGYSKKEFLSMTLKDITPTSDYHTLLNDLERFRKQNSSHILASHLKKNGEIMYIELTSIKTIYKGKDARHILIKDITDKKKSEIELNKKMDELIRFQEITVNRELTMISLKKEINELLLSKGQKEKYKIVE